MPITKNIARKCVVTALSHVLRFGVKCMLGEKDFGFILCLKLTVYKILRAQQNLGGTKTFGEF